MEPSNPMTLTTKAGEQTMNYGAHITLGDLLEFCDEIPETSTILVLADDYPHGESWCPLTHIECRYNYGEETTFLDCSREDSPLRVSDIVYDRELHNGNPFSAALKLNKIDPEGGYRMPLTQMHYEEIDRTLYLQ